MSIVEKIDVSNTTVVIPDGFREKAMRRWASNPHHQADPSTLLAAIMLDGFLLGKAAITATGLTEAQLEGLANGTMVVVPIGQNERIDGLEKLVEKLRWLSGIKGDGTFIDTMIEQTAELYAHWRDHRAMLAAKEGHNV